MLSTGDQRLFLGAEFRFVRHTDYNYDARCLEGEKVTLVKLGGYPPAQVMWHSGFTYWVNAEDLEDLDAPLSDDETALTSQLGQDIIPNVSFDNDVSLKCSGMQLRQVDRMPDIPRSR